MQSLEKDSRVANSYHPTENYAWLANFNLYKIQKMQFAFRSTDVEFVNHLI